VITLEQILDLVGSLDDAPGNDTPRERFRRFLQDSITSTGAVRDYVEACTKNKGPQYDHALQDLVNHIGSLIGFEVGFGRYKGVTNDIGHDGLWRWKDFSIVVEVKTTDAFAIKTETLLSYGNKLVSNGKIADSERWMGLYVFARVDSELKSLSNSIVAEKHTRQLRISTVDDVLSLAELVQEGHLSADEAVTLLRPEGVFIADTVKLLTRIAAGAIVPRGEDHANKKPEGAIDESQATYRPEPNERIPQSQTPILKKPRVGAAATNECMFLITPVSDEAETSAEETITKLLSAGWYVFADKTPGRKWLKPGDRICFYRTGVGVVAQAEVASTPERKPPSTKGIVKNLDKFPWSFRLSDVRFFFDEPIAITPDLRSKLEVFADRDPRHPWSWFVQGTKIVSAHDFEVLTVANI
jgi:hypothetical protein